MPSSSVRLRVRATPGHEAEAASLARHLGVPFGPGPSAWVLVRTDDGLCAAEGDPDAPEEPSVSEEPSAAPDEGAAALARRGVRADLVRARPGGETIVRAVRGRSRGDGPLRVVDATAGWGGDAGALWRAGMRVVAIERDPVVAALLADAVRRLHERDPSGAERFRLVEGDAVTRLQELTERPDAVYLDPMYPRTGGGAKRRGAAWLRAWLGAGGSEEQASQAELLEAARALALRRVVVKRPLRGPELAPGVSGSVRGSTTRFDIYPPTP